MSKDTIILESHKFDIKVEEVEFHQYNGLDASWLTLKILGNDINIKIVNALRRVASNNLPMYAFPTELINITTNTTVAFNNDYMRLRLSQLPVMGVDSGLCSLSEKYWYKVNYADLQREKHPKEKTVEFYIKNKNDSINIVSVTTNDIIVTIDGENINPYNKEYPILLVKLRPNDKFECHMKAVLGVGENHVIWKGARNCYYDEINKDNKNEYIFTIEGNQQCHEYEMMIRTCKFIIEKLINIKNDLIKQIESKQISQDKIIYFKLEQEDHTIGEILNYEFQDHKDIITSGLSKPDYLIKAVLIKVTSVAKVNTPLNAMLESIDILKNKFSHLGKIFYDLYSDLGYKPNKKDKKKKEK